MSDVTPGLLVGFIFGSIAGMAFSIAVIISVGDSWWERQIVERGYAQYCPMTGDWAWKGECDE